MSMQFIQLGEEQIELSLLRGFRRHQEETNCWRKENGRWQLKNIPFVEEWSEAEYAFLVKCLKNTDHTGGFVLGAFDEERLVGFASVENKPFGSKNQYVQLSCIHVSEESRGMGIGKRLFVIASEAGRRLGAEKLYISAHSAKESQAFYHAMGCIEAREYSKELSEAEPCDCQLEFVL